MKIGDWLKRLEYELVQGSLDEQVSEVVYDSRKAGPDSVFVCIKGSVRDSHTFLSDVLAAGCRVVAVEDLEAARAGMDSGIPSGVTVLLVKNGRLALAELSAARFGYPAERMVTIGITGTKGKTTTSYMVKTILETAGKKVGLIGTNGAVIGNKRYPTANTTPESYVVQQYFAEMAEAGCDCMVMEVSSQALMLNRVGGIRFDYGLFTNISPDHIGPKEHGSFEEYLYYKSRLLTVCGVGVVNRGMEHFDEVVRDASCRLYTYGLERPADLMGEQIRYVSEPDFVGTSFDVRGMYENRIRVGMPGRFNADNALAAVSVCLLALSGAGKAADAGCGEGDGGQEGRNSGRGKGDAGCGEGDAAGGICADADVHDAILHALEHVRVDGRMEIAYVSETCSVIVDYAHNAVSMESLLLTLRDYRPKRLVCVFGCGGNRAKERRYSMGEIGGKLADLCILTADNPRFEKNEDIIRDIETGMARTEGNYIVIPDRREAIAYAMQNAEPGDMIAVIGKGHEDYQEIEGVRHHFLDREVIEEIGRGLYESGLQ